MRGGIAVVVVAAIAAAAMLVVLPWYVRSRCVEEAQAHGIALTIDDVRVGAGGFRLDGASASFAEVPGAAVHAAEVDVTMSGLRPEAMTMRGAQLDMKGRWSVLSEALAKWRASPRGGRGGDWTPASLAADGARITWTGPVSDNARIDAADVHIDVTWGTLGVEAHARSDRVTVGVPDSALGPWRIDVDRSPAPERSLSGTWRVRVAFDPDVPDTSTLLVVGDDRRTTSVDVQVPRAPLAHLGVAPALLGLRGKDLQVQAQVHYATMSPGRADASAKGGLYGIETGMPLPIDIAFEASAGGDPRAGLDVKKARLAAGPLVGTLTGTLRSFDDGFRCDLAWRAGPVPCAAFDQPLAGGQPFDVAYQLRKLAEATGLTKLAGDVSASGTLAFDSRDLGATRVTFAPEAKCGVAVFGP